MINPPNISATPTRWARKRWSLVVDTAPHGVQTPTLGTLLLIGVREGGGPHPLEAIRLSKFTINSHDLVDLSLMIETYHVFHDREYHSADHVRTEQWPHYNG